MAGLGKKTFAAGEVLRAADVNGYLMEQSIMSFAGTAARGSAIGTPWQGAKTFLQDSGVTSTYFGTFGTASNPGGRDVAGWYDTEKTNGLVAIRPSTATFVTGSGSVDAVGQATFTNVTSLSLDNVFSSKYDYYRILLVATNSTALSTTMRLRAGGSDNSAASYYDQAIRAQSTSVSSFFTSGATNFGIVFTTAAGVSHFTYDIFNPAKAEYTRILGQGENTANPFVGIYAGWHAVATAYDGLTITADTGNITGTVQVFGYLTA